ncbi:Leucine-rich repeat [Trinorchestia longiramus]|nr:Leucine-rich repeat [Trinorchestia longiramus]
MATRKQGAPSRQILAVRLATIRVALQFVVVTLVMCPVQVAGGPLQKGPDVGTTRVNLRFVETKGGIWKQLEQSTPLAPQRKLPQPPIANIKEDEIKAPSSLKINRLGVKASSNSVNGETEPLGTPITGNAPQTWRNLGLESASLARDTTRRSQDRRRSSFSINRNFRSACPEDCKCGLITGVTCYSPSDTALLPKNFPIGIRVLTLFGYKIIRGELTELTDLKELSIFDGNLTESPQLPGSLTHLRITNSNLRNIDSLQTLNYLQSLNLAHNNITGADLSTLTDLVSLDMSNNPLQKLPYLPRSLIILDLHNTDLQAQPMTWDEYLPNLRQLILTGMKMRQTPYLILPKLEYLDMSHSEISTLPFLSSLPNLKEINLSHLKVSEALPEQFKGAFELEKVDLSYTNISSLPTKIFVNNPKLKEIQLHHTSLQSINDYTFSELWDLETLIVSSNSDLMNIDDKSLATLNKLQVLDISDTLTRILPYSIRNLNLTHFAATDVTLLCDCHAFWLPSYLSTIESTTSLTGVLPVKCTDGIERSIQELEDHLYDQDCVPPDIVSPPDVTLRRGVGKTALLECNATGSPHPNVIWVSPTKEYYSHEHIELEPWFSEKFRYVVERINYLDAESLMESKIQPLKSGQLLIQNMTRDDVGLYRCIAVNAIASVVSTTSLWLTTDDMQAFEMETLLFGLACAMMFLLTTLIVQLIRYIMDRMGWECCCCRDRLSSRAMQVKKLLESIEAYKSQQLDRLKDNYNYQVVSIKEGCYQQMERLSDSYSQQCRNLQSIKDYSTQQLTTARDQYVEQVNRVRDYSVGQMNKVSENYVFQRQRVRKFSAHQLFKLRETYKYQQKTLNKILENIPDLYLQNCRTGGNCNRADSIVFDDEIHGIDAYYRLDFLNPIGASNEGSEDMFYTPSSTLTNTQRNIFIHQHQRNTSSCSASTTEYQEAFQSWATNTPTLQSPKTSPSHLTTPQLSGKYRALTHSRSLSTSGSKPTTSNSKGHELTHRRTHSANIQTRSSIPKVHSSPSQEKSHRPQRPKSVELTHLHNGIPKVFIETNNRNEEAAKLKNSSAPSVSDNPRSIPSHQMPCAKIEPHNPETETSALLKDESLNMNYLQGNSEASSSANFSPLHGGKPDTTNPSTSCTVTATNDVLNETEHPKRKNDDFTEMKKSHSSKDKSLSREGSKEMESRFALPAVTEDQEPTSSSSSSNETNL